MSLNTDNFLHINIELSIEITLVPLNTVHNSCYCVIQIFMSVCIFCLADYDGQYALACRAPLGIITVYLIQLTNIIQECFVKGKLSRNQQIE